LTFLGQASNPGLPAATALELLAAMQLSALLGASQIGTRPRARPKTQLAQAAVALWPCFKPKTLHAKSLKVRRNHQEPKLVFDTLQEQAAKQIGGQAAIAFGTWIHQLK
jgi:hypothetical protein